MGGTYDLSPLYRSLIGADHLASLMEGAFRPPADNLPPYDIEKTGDDRYRISVAAAGFRADELEIMAQPNLLIVRGRRGEHAGNAEGNLHRGLALGPFEHRFDLADHVIVTDAHCADGLLTIDLVREIPEALKPRRIDIKSGPATALTPLAPLARLMDRKRRPQKAA